MNDPLVDEIRESLDSVRAVLVDAIRTYALRQARLHDEITHLIRSADVPPQIVERLQALAESLDADLADNGELSRSMRSLKDAIEALAPNAAAPIPSDIAERTRDADVVAIESRFQDAESFALEQRIDSLKVELRRQSKRLEQQIAYRDRANTFQARTRRDLTAAREELDTLRNSFAFRLGSLLVAAVRSPRGLLLLPLGLAGLGKALWPRVWRRMRRMLAGQTGDGRPDLGPDVQLTSEAAAWLERQSGQEASVERLRAGADLAARLPEQAARLRVATIMDEFSFSAYRHCCEMLPLNAAQWQLEVEEFSPHLLLVESAWKGQDESWSRKVYPLSRELVELVAWCRERGIPTVFWNKEDPVHLSVFMKTARQFDFVFTTDIDCVRAYKAALGHDQVYWLPFACQPQEHNPVEEYDRKDAFCFAGSYYAKYPERQQDFATLIGAMCGLRPCDIYDRNAGKDAAELAYPEQYQPMIKGALPYDRISLAYKGYRFGINLNTVKQSQSMFARRAFELLACNTVTVSNFSRGLRLMLGDLVVSSDDGSQLTGRIAPLLADARDYRRFRLAGLRKVMSEHTCQDRLRYVLEKVRGSALDDELPGIVVVGAATDVAAAMRLFEAFARQHYRHKTLWLVGSAEVLDRLPQRDGIACRLFTNEQARTVGLDDAGPGAWIACFSASDHYGANYLTDLALATRYASNAVIGKGAFHRSGQDGVQLVSPDAAYRAQSGGLPLRRGMTKADELSGTLAWLMEQGCDHLLSDAFGIDEFNYCQNGAGTDCSAVDDLPGLWAGLPLDTLYRLAEAASGETLIEARTEAGACFTVSRLSRMLPMGGHADGRIELTTEDDAMLLRSAIKGNEHVYLYAIRPVPVEEFFPKRIGKFNFVVQTEMLLSFVLIYLDAEYQRIGHTIRACSSNLSITPPAGTRHVRLGLRVQGPGTARLQGLLLGHAPSLAAGIPARAEHLLVSRGYPSYEHLYSYAYVHRRVLGYYRHGIPIDVFRLTEDHVSYSEFEGVDIVSGQLSDLELMLQSNPHRTVLVHSLDRALWSVLKQHAGDSTILAWVHGAEIQPWFRRDFSFLDERDRERGMQRSNDRMAFWRELLADPPSNLRLVFVSRHLVREAERDVGIALDPSRYEVIHNHIDEALFSYVPKDPAQRMRILSIRPYSRPTYANDLTVKAILDLSREPYFQDLEFRLIGDGRLFEETVEPLREFSNVVLEQRFLTQAEIAALHKDYGIFLCPSRIDSQGVSRDEAMASGLVPITNRVSAIPEFVDDQCALIADPEDWQGMADAVRRLYAEPDTFLEMSAAASRRVREQSGHEQTLAQELALMRAVPPLSAQDPGPPSPPRMSRQRVAIYGDLDLNLIDGSAVWAASLAEALAGNKHVDVDLFLKTPIRNTQVIRGLLGLVNVRLVEPPAGVAVRQREDAIDSILEADTRCGYQAVLLRGFDLACAAVACPGLTGRLWIYLTDVPHRREDFTPERLQALQEVAEGASLVLCQTAELERHLVVLAPAAAGKTRLLPPMIPNVRHQSSRPSRKPGDPLKIAYAGKFAPLWGIRELFDTVDKLRAEGLPIELHVFGDKIHDPADDPDFRSDVRSRLEGGSGLIWYRGLSRVQVLEKLAEMDLGWAWRNTAFEEASLELSTKVLEYMACGIPVLLARNRINADLLGDDYPLFVAEEDLDASLRALFLGDRPVDEIRLRLAALAERFTFRAVESSYLTPLLRPESEREQPE